MLACPKESMYLTISIESSTTALHSADLVLDKVQPSSTGARVNAALASLCDMSRDRRLDSSSVVQFSAPFSGTMEGRRLLVHGPLHHVWLSVNDTETML